MSSRTVAVPDHLWETLEQMGKEMGVPAQALVSQAIFTLARLNGYVVPGKTSGSQVSAAISSVLTDASIAQPSEPENTSARRIAQIAEDLDSLIREKSVPGAKAAELLPDARPSSPGELLESAEASEADEGEWGEPEPEPEQELETASPGQRQAKDEEELVEQPSTREERHRAREEAMDNGGEPPSLFIQGAEGEPIVMPPEQERFLIGRGKHCDFVINSNRVSREHAVIVREGGEVHIEDLKSSNGTWYKKQRINRRKIEEGDEFLLGTEKLRCTFQGHPD